MMKKLFFGATLAFVMAACGIVNSPAVVQDFNAVVTCVLANLSNPLACTSYAAAEIEAVIQYLLSDSAFRAAHPEDIPILQNALPTVHAQAVKEAIEKANESK